MTGQEAAPPIWVDGIEPLAERFDGFIIDQWGVLHDGRQTYPGAVDVLSQLRALGKPAVVLSNSGKRAADNGARLAAMGIEPEHYTAVVSSGEAAWMALKHGDDPEVAGLGRRCLLVSRGGDRNIVNDLDIELAGGPDDADFLLIAGVDEDGWTASDLEGLLGGARRRDLPMLCANPDRQGIIGDRIVPTPGVLADRYLALGGSVISFGKPDPAIYRQARRFFGDLPADRILAIGDSLENDIAGGRVAGHGTLLIANGIHRGAFADATAPEQRDATLAQLSQQYGATPDWVMAGFHW